MKLKQLSVEDRLRRRLRIGWALALRSGVDAGVIETVFSSDWEEVEVSENNRPGIMGGSKKALSMCECGQEYTCNTDQQRMATAPTDEQKDECLKNPPEPEPKCYPCDEPCVPVITHLWHGWAVCRNKKTGEYVLNSNTFAQYHCEYDDPGDPPEPNPPPDPDST